MANEQN